MQKQLKVSVLSGNCSCMQKFLLIQSRAEDQASDAEYNSFLKLGSLNPDEVHRVRGEQDGVLNNINPSDYSAVLVGGGPFSMSDPENEKTLEQKNFEKEMNRLFDEILEKDIPCLAVCYGIGLSTKHQGGVVSKKYGEDIGVKDITLSETGMKDVLLKDLPATFRAVVGHKEACEIAPSNAVVLASSDTCPVQMMRFGKNVYITQFHPELEIETLAERIRIYKNYGYFKPEEAQSIIDKVQGEDISSPWLILGKFIERYRT